MIDICEEINYNVMRLFMVLVDLTCLTHQLTSPTSMPIIVLASANKPIVHIKSFARIVWGLEKNEGTTSMTTELINTSACLYMTLFGPDAPVAIIVVKQEK